MSGDTDTDHPTNGRATTASVDRRIERLENRQDDLQRAVDSLSADVRVISTEMTAQSALLAKVDGSLHTLKNMLTGPLSEAAQSAAGRGLLADIEDVRATARAALAKSERTHTELSTRIDTNDLERAKLRSQIDTVLAILRFVGLTGLAIIVLALVALGAHTLGFTIPTPTP